MGADVPDKQIESSLKRPRLRTRPRRSNRGAEGSLLAAWECTQPSWRAEVEREIDLIEEVARIYGLDKFPSRLPAARIGAARLPHYEAEARLRERLIGLGYREIITHSPRPRKIVTRLFRPPDAQPARLANPLSEEANVLKSTGIVTMAAALEWNLNRGQRNLRLFEIGRHYRLRGAESVETPILTLGATGQAREKGLYDSPRDYSFADLKGDVDALGVLANSFHVERKWPRLAASRPSRHVRPQQRVSREAGELTRRIADQLKLRQEIFLAELRLAPFVLGHPRGKRISQVRTYPALPRRRARFFPAPRRRHAFSDVVAAIRAIGIREVTSIEAVDLFRGKNVPAGQYSLLVRVTFQSRESTLTESPIKRLLPTNHRRPGKATKRPPPKDIACCWPIATVSRCCRTKKQNDQHRVIPSAAEGPAFFRTSRHTSQIRC